ncbi:hypothetical protein GSbR_13910 [Geobacter sp. SVR]|nr:hypothetical protein GSVR_43360 [Geobacter sp. SVR]GCF84791.1 hypothetical protein GSbR_13910 [Geobacter sp. SVR]
MDAGHANAHARVIAGLHAALLREGQAGRDGLLALTDADSPAVAGMAAVYAIRLDPPRCLAALHRVAAEPGLLGFRASVAIQRWETGEWEDPA